MKQLGNLAVVCATRKDVLFQVLNGMATVYIGQGPERASMSAQWNDDEKINEIIRELNFGEYKNVA